MSNWDFPFFRPGILEGVLALPLDPDTAFQQVARRGSFANPPNPA